MPAPANGKAQFPLQPAPHAGFPPRPGQPQGCIALLHGEVPADAPPDEQDVLEELHAVASVLRGQGWQTAAVPLALDAGSARSRLKSLRPDAVVNLVESVAGSGRWIGLGPQLLDALALPYTGAGRQALERSSHKPLAKGLMLAAGIPTPPWWTGTCMQGLEQPGLLGRTPDRWIVKSEWEHASIGIDDESIVSSAAVSARLVERRARYGGEWFAEAYVPGREFNLSLLGRPGVQTDGPGVELLPPAEIHFKGFPDGKPHIVNYAAKWDPQAFEYGATPRSFAFAAEDAALLAHLQQLALECWAAFGLTGYARVDFRVDAQGQPWVLEVNANPCLAPDAGFAAAAARAGLDYATLVARIVKVALWRAGVQHPPRHVPCS